jgi:hypothetical protein
LNFAGSTNEWEYGTYEFDENNMSSSNSTTEDNNDNSQNEYIPGTFEGLFEYFISVDFATYYLTSTTTPFSVSLYRTGKDP